MALIITKSEQTFTVEEQSLIQKEAERLGVDKIYASEIKDNELKEKSFFICEYAAEGTLQDPIYLRKTKTLGMYKNFLAARIGLSEHYKSYSCQMVYSTDYTIYMLHDDSDRLQAILKIEKGQNSNT